MVGGAGYRGIRGLEIDTWTGNRYLGWGYILGLGIYTWTWEWILGLGLYTWAGVIYLD